MGCDGGTIPKRDELVRTKKKPEQKDKISELSFKWGHCSLTQEPLQNPIVACQLGRLYSKISIIEALLDHTLPDSYKYIKSIKDLKELNLTHNPDFKDTDTKSDSFNDSKSPYICPVIGIEMNGKYRFVYFWSCGCVVSERALRVVKTKICHKCQKPFSDDDVIILNGTESDINLMIQNMKQRQLKMKAEKKQKKNFENDVNKKNKLSPSVINNEVKLNNFKEENSKQITHKLTSTSTLSCKRKSGSSQIEDPDFKKTKFNYSVSKDPKATEVFKSIFTSHKSADKQEKAHWITYNPFYN